MDQDQAAGLRRLFAPRRAALVPVVDNPALAGADSLLDALVGAYLERGLQVLVVDAGARAEPATDLVRVDLAACVDTLSSQVRWLAAGGLVAHHLDARGSAGSLVAALQDTVPQAEVIVLRASAADLARVLMDQPPTRVVLTLEPSQSQVMAVYASLKWLHLRAGCGVFSLLVAGSERLPLARAAAQQLGACAERFLGATVPVWAAIEPQVRARLRTSPALRRLAYDSLGDEGANRPLSGHDVDLEHARTMRA